MANAPKKRLFEQIARLRRAERDPRDSRDIVAVRAALEEEFGHTVSRALAADLLGVSHTGLQRWIERGDVPLVQTRHGRREVPLAALLDLYEAVEAERRAGRRHVLEPGLVEAHRRAERLRPRDLVENVGDPDGHRRAELRSLAYHRALAKRLRRAMADDALRLVWQWRESGQMADEYAERWEDLLRRPLPEIREAITADDQRGRDLRQNSPFAGALSEPERQRILAEIR